MKPSHTVTPRSTRECVFDPSGDPFDWGSQPRRMAPALVWLIVILGLATLGLAVVR